MKSPTDKKKSSEAEKRERGIAENERANYSEYPPEDEDTKQRQKKSSIRETDDPKETDHGASDLAGTASGNLEPDDLPDDED